MSASADIATKRKEDVISVPINAVTTRDKNDSIKGALKPISTDPSKPPKAAAEDDLEILVFVVDKDGMVKKIKVTTGIQDINFIEVTSGLKTDELVVTAPYDVVNKTLKEKDKVIVVDKKELYDSK